MKKYRFIIALVVILVVIPVRSQETTEDQHPLFEMLSLAPDVPEVRKVQGVVVNYVDYRAALASRPGAAQPQSWEEFEALRNADDPSLHLWIAALNGLRSEFLMVSLVQADEMPEAVGFDLFDVDRSVVFGEPPWTGQILTGDFDADAIRSAFGANGFVEHQLGGLEVWCGVDGCDRGLDVNVAERNPANPFGGQLGRKQPLVITPDTSLFSSGSLEVVENYMAVYNGDLPSLLDTPEYRTAAEAITQNGTLIQAQFINPALFSVGNPLDLMVSPDLSASESAAERERLAENFVPLPPYSLLVLANVVVAPGDSYPDELAQVVLVYDDEADAQAAVDALPTRLSTYTSFTFDKPLVELIEERGATIESPYRYTSTETGQTAVVLMLRAPVPPEEPDALNGQYIISGLTYRLLSDALYRVDMGWLAVEAASP
jgi:hypothetical protein